jgi:hypothetical protein
MNVKLKLNLSPHPLKHLNLLKNNKIKIVPFSISTKTRKNFTNDFLPKTHKTHQIFMVHVLYIYQIKIDFNGIITIEPNVQKKMQIW